ncbi:hypothetical protein C8R44DRAFT_876660 [Mycena epipterygia]|nr:hypothetical protein C8R44DRAFT_876660 [Mycena epipterygia]
MARALTSVNISQYYRNNLTILVTDGISEYLRRLNVHLKHLRIRFKIPVLFREQVEFDSNIALQTIQLEHGISFVVKDDTDKILISSMLLEILQRFHSSCLEALIIGVIHETPQLTGDYASIQDFARVLNLPHYTRLRRLQFRSLWEENGTAEDFTSILIDELPPRVAGLLNIFEAEFT